MRVALICAFCMIATAIGGSWSPVVPEAQANSKVKRATKYYLRGMKQFRKRSFGSAISSFRRAARLLPRHPHFNCHRTKFYTYVGRSYEGKRSPRSAMRAYKKARRSGCSKGSRFARRRYSQLYRRWVTSIRIFTTPKKARVYLVLKKRDKYIGKTPLKRVLQPGSYKFKVRLFDHKTVVFKVKLRPGRHIKKRLKLVKGDDPIVRTEKTDIAPPPTMAKLKTTKVKKKKKKKKKEEKDPIVILDDK